MRRKKLFIGVAAVCISFIMSVGLLTAPGKDLKVGLDSKFTSSYRRTRKYRQESNEKSIGSNHHNNVTSPDEAVSGLRECPEAPPNLFGPVNVSLEMPSFEEMETMFPRLLPGGHFRPLDCKSRDREKHLRILLHNLHPILMRQQLDYGIYLAQQVDGSTFNKALLMNADFAEALDRYDYQCFIFHDVDLIPEDDRNLYHCLPEEGPRHMSVAIDLFHYKLYYESLVGGVLAMSKEQMIKVNGFSNEYWEWGGEDDMGYRIKHHGFKISRYPDTIARYKMLKHAQEPRSPNAFDTLDHRNQRFEWDGLTSLKYQLLNIRFEILFTTLLLNISRIPTKTETALRDEQYVIPA